MSIFFFHRYDDHQYLHSFPTRRSSDLRDNSYTVPLVKNNKLAGLLLRYDPRSQLMDAIPAPVIAHFLRDAAKPKRSEEHTSELQSHSDLVCRLLLEKKKTDH